MKSFFRAFALVASGRIAASICYTLLLLVVARAAGAQDFGVLSAALGAGLFLGALFDLGLTTFVLKEEAVAPHSGRVRTALRISVTSLVVTCLSMFLVGALALQLEWALATLIALGIGLDKFTDAWQATLIANGHDAAVSGLTVGRRAVALIVAVSLMASGVDALLAFGIATTLAGLAIQLFRPWALRKLSSAAVSWTQSLEVLREALGYWVAVVAAQARELDATFVLWASSATAAGMYSAGARLSRPVLLLAGSLANVVLPHLARRDRGAARRMATVLGTAALLLVLVGTLLAPAVPWAVTVVLGSEFSAAVPIATVFMIAIGPIAVSSVFGSLLQAHGYGRFVAVNGVVFAAVSLLVVGIAAAFGGAFWAAVAISSVLFFKYLSLWSFSVGVLRDAKD